MPHPRDVFVLVARVGRHKHFNVIFNNLLTCPFQDWERPMDEFDMLRAAYRDFNARNIEAVLEHMSPD
ncbi:MAG: hypothetical protein WBE41_14465, partial [Terracidiphilus sp.]